VQPDDSRVVYRGEDESFGVDLELQALPLNLRFGDNLEGELAARLPTDYAEDLTGPALTDLFKDLVLGKNRGAGLAEAGGGKEGLEAIAHYFRGVLLNGSDKQTGNEYGK
jgi:hypothetical protein